MATMVKQTRGKRTTAKRTSSVARRKTAARATATKRLRAKRVPKPTAVATAKAMAAGALAAVVRLMPWARAEADAIALLEADHRRFEALFEAGAETTTRAVVRRRRLLASLTAELTVHELIEEKLLYPSLAPHPEVREIVLEGTQEHHVADVLLKELRRMDPRDERWAAKWKVLQESIEHHIQEEERQMFPLARGVLDAEAIHALGLRMRKLRARHRG